MPVKSLSISQIERLRDCGILIEDCPVEAKRLVNVETSYCDFDGVIRDDGLITVLDVLSQSVENIFAELLQKGFPIAKMRPIEFYDGDDKLSMEDNNSSAFNCRPIGQSSIYSIHSYGCAIDVNPLQNPFLEIDELNGSVKVNPSEGWRFLNRGNFKLGMVEDVVSIFEEQGFVVWGGSWTTPIDYHHFQLPRSMSELLVSIEFSDGLKIFNQFKGNPDALGPGVTAEYLKGLYQSQPEYFSQNFSSIVSNKK